MVELVVRMKAHGVTWDSTNLPVELRADEATFKGGTALRAASDMHGCTNGAERQGCARAAPEGEAETRSKERAGRLRRLIVS